LAGHAEHILTCVPMSRRLELAAGGAERRVLAARDRGVPFNSAVVLRIPAIPRSCGSM
jgi:hypothetical protein